MSLMTGVMLIVCGAATGLIVIAAFAVVHFMHHLPEEY